MADARLPAYVQPRRLADGKRAYFWVRPAWANPKLATSPDPIVARKAIRAGKTCPVESMPLGTVLGAAVSKAEAQNAAFAEWRKGIQHHLAPGSVKWLFDWYRADERFTGKAYMTRKGYRVAMDAVEEIAMKVGKFGERQARAIDATAADMLYKRAREKHGERQGSYMMQVCRLVWNQAQRHKKATGVTENPFAGMGIKSKSAGGNRAATRAEYNAYRAAAHALGKPSMAAAAALCFEGCQRVWDAFGFLDPDGAVSRGIRWDGYKPAERLSLVQSKTGNLVNIPLVERIDGEDVPLYPELEQELGGLERRDDGGLIVRDERSGEPYTRDYMRYAHKQVRVKAGLPADLRFTSFRHGGISEIGDAGETDMRAVSGHSTLDITRVYNKANDEKARKIALRRREHITLVTAGAEE